jgi:hypothetical protein
MGRLTAMETFVAVDEDVAFSARMNRSVRSATPALG